MLALVELVSSRCQNNAVLLWQKTFGDATHNKQLSFKLRSCLLLHQRRQQQQQQHVELVKPKFLLIAYSLSNYQSGKAKVSISISNAVTFSNYVTEIHKYLLISLHIIIHNIYCIIFLRLLNSAIIAATNSTYMSLIHIYFGMKNGTIRIYILSQIRFRRLTCEPKRRSTIFVIKTRDCDMRNNVATMKSYCVI